MRLLVLVLLLSLCGHIFSLDCPSPPDLNGKATNYGTMGPRFTGLHPGDEALYHCRWYGQAFLVQWDIERVTARLRCRTDGQWVDIETRKVIKVDTPLLCRPSVITLRRQVWQSSTLDASFDAQNAIVHSANLQQISLERDLVARTQIQTDPWWVVDLGETFLVVNVLLLYPVKLETQLYSKTQLDSVGPMTGDMQLSVIASMLMAFNPLNPSFIGEKKCDKLNSFISGSTQYDCRMLHDSGRFVAVRKIGVQVSLVLKDVTVYGVAVSVNISRWCGMCKSGSLCVSDLKRTACDCVHSSAFDVIGNCESTYDECSVDYVNTFYCKCLSGYTGVYCETDIDECQSDPCQNGGSCSDIDNGYRCKCTEGHFGVSCEAKRSKASEVRITGTVSGLSEMDELNLRCEARGGQPNMYTYAWHFKPKYEGNEKIIKGQELRLSTLKYNDSGSYECQATNEAGTSIKAEWVEVRHSPNLKATDMDATWSIFISKTTAITMWLNWRPGPLRGPFTIFYRMFGLTKWNINNKGIIAHPNDSDLLSVQIDRLESDTAYELKIAAQSSESPIVTAKTRTLPPDPGKINITQYDTYVEASWEDFAGDFDYAAFSSCIIDKNQCASKHLQNDTTNVNMTLVMGEEYSFSLKLFQADVCVASSKEQHYVAVGDFTDTLSRYAFQISDKTTVKVYRTVGLVCVLVAVAVGLAIAIKLKRPKKSDDKIVLLDAAAEIDQENADTEKDEHLEEEVTSDASSFNANSSN